MFPAIFNRDVNILVTSYKWLGFAVAFFPTTLVKSGIKRDNLSYKNVNKQNIELQIISLFCPYNSCTDEIMYLMAAMHFLNICNYETNQFDWIMLIFQGLRFHVRSSVFKRIFVLWFGNFGLSSFDLVTFGWRNFCIQCLFTFLFIVWYTNF